MPPSVTAPSALPSRNGIVSRIRHRAGASPLAPDAEFWHGLSSSFFRHRERFDLNAWDAARVGATAGFDVLLRTFAATMLGLTAMPLGFHPRALRDAMAMREYYEALADHHDPDRVFIRPPKDVEIRHDLAWRPIFVPSDGVCEDLSFLSPYQPIHPSLKRAYVRHRANMVAHARYWRHDGTARPTIVAIHGFGADSYWLNEWFFALRWFYEHLGCDVALFTLPFHGLRQARISPFSGHGFFAGGIPRINEALAQAVCDFRVFLHHLHHNLGAPAVGVTGISLGGYTTALLASVEPSLAFAVPNVPVVSMVDLVFEWEPVGTLLRRMLPRYGLSVADARHMLAMHTPLNYAPAIARDRLMLIGGVADRLAPPHQTRLLWEHWQRPRLHWFPGSHVLHLDKGDYMQHFATFLQKIAFIT